MVASEQELQAVEKQLTYGIKPEITHTTSGTIKLYYLKDGAKVTVRGFSSSGGRTLEVRPQGGVSSGRIEYRLHIEKIGG